MLLSAVSVLVVGQQSSEIPEGLLNYSVDRKNVTSCWLCFRDILAMHGHMKGKKKNEFDEKVCLN